MSSIKDVCIVGAGVVGLSCAYQILEEFNGSVRVTVVAESFANQTTSYGSAGLWEPYQIAGTEEGKINEWGRISFNHFLDLYTSPSAAVAGVQMMTAYQLFEAHEEFNRPPWSDIVFNFTELSTSDLRKLRLPERFVKGYSFVTFVVDQKYYLQYLMTRLSDAGVIFHQQKLASLDEIETIGHQGPFDVIVNCSGLGAYGLCDKSMYPIRGQVLRVKAPWLKSVWFFGTSYVIPNVDNVVLGGTAQKGDWSTVASRNDSNKILSDVAELFPAIRDCPVENVWAGLRPGRAPLRLETEPAAPATAAGGSPTAGAAEGSAAGAVASSSQRWWSQAPPPPPPRARVVHCYGHGGSGVTLAMGCAADVAANHVRPLLGLPPRAPAAAAAGGSGASGSSSGGGGGGGIGGGEGGGGGSAGRVHARAGLARL